MEVKGHKNLLTYSLFILASAFFPFLLIAPNNFPYFGIGLFFITLSSLLFVFKKEKKGSHLLLYILTLIFSVCIFYRANSLLVFLNILTVLYLGSVLTLGENAYQSFLYLFLSPIHTFIQLLKEKNIYKLHMSSITKKYIANIGKASDLLSSVVITFAILCVIIPLLSYANPFFNKLVSDFFAFISIQKLLELLFKDFFFHIIRILFFFLFVFIIPRMITYANSSHEITFAKVNVNFTNKLFLPKIVVGIVLAIFFITQAQLYFATSETLTALRYSHSQYTREVFAHLSIVTLIIFGLIYADKTKNSWGRITTYLLIAEAMFLNSIALKSVFDYTSSWGFTHKRLYGYALVAWIFGLFSLFSYRYVKDVKETHFIRNTFFWTICIFFIINLTNFDYIMYHYAKSRTYKGIDHYYLATSLSSDAGSYRQHLDQLVSSMKKDGKENFEQVQAGRILLEKIARLIDKYEHLDLRDLNISEYVEYLDVRDMDRDFYRNKLDMFTPRIRSVQQENMNIQEANQPQDSVPRYKMSQQQVYPSAVQPSVTQQRTFSAVKVTIINLDKKLFNHNFEIKDKETNTLLVQGSLDADSFDHTVGEGKFVIDLYENRIWDDKQITMLVKELPYEINNSETKGKEIQYTF